MEPVISKRILDEAGKAAENFDWLSMPPHQRIIPEETFKWLTSEEMSGFLDEKENLEPGSSKRMKTESARFEEVEATSSSQLATYAEGFVPPNTQANTNWFVRVFNEWADWRRSPEVEDSVPGDILTCGDAKPHPFLSHSRHPISLT